VGNGPGLNSWTVSSPEAAGLSRRALEAAADKLGAKRERQGLVVVRHGEVAFEHYWANAWARAVPEWRNVSFSSGKSWGSAMVGRAATLGALQVDDLANKYLPSAISGLHPETRIRHLLTMSSGGTMRRKPSSTRPKRLDDTSPPGPPAEYQWHTEPETPNAPAGYGRTLRPGALFYYDGVPADCLADIVAAAVGKSSHRFMMEDVAGPLGCEHFGYQREGVDSNDNVRIGGSILLSCRDMARLGQLFLNRGAWGGRELIDASYIRDATTPSALNSAYGFLWWLNRTGRAPGAPHSMFYAAGARGQFCFVLPEQDMVIATMGFGEEQLSIEEAWTALASTLPE
jgi:CubicO group peptidase (beta-lactamase class C family)